MRARVGQTPVRIVPVGEQQLDSLQRASSMRGHPGWVGERGEHLLHDAQAWFLPATADDLTSDGVLEAGGTEAVGGESRSIADRQVGSTSGSAHVPSNNGAVGL